MSRHFKIFPLPLQIFPRCSRKMSLTEDKQEASFLSLRARSMNLLLESRPNANEKIQSRNLSHGYAPLQMQSFIAQ